MPNWIYDMPRGWPLLFMALATLAILLGVIYVVLTTVF